MSIRKVAVLEGAWGGTAHINKMSQSPAECIVVGEIHEWETSEYVRDAISAGIKKSLIVAGHAATEEPGMEWLAKWLAPHLEGIRVTHGMNVVVARPVTVGKGAVVAANSLIMSDVAPYTIVAGVPAVKLKDRFEK